MGKVQKSSEDQYSHTEGGFEDLKMSSGRCVQICHLVGAKSTREMHRMERNEEMRRS